MSKAHKSIWLRFDRVLAHDLLKQALILLVLFGVLFVVSFVLLSFSGGDWEAFCREKDLPKWLLPLYLLIDTNAYSNLYFGHSVHGWMLFASSLTYLSGLFVFNGMIISLMTNAVSLRIERHNDGLIHYLRSGHYIIMGYDEMCPSIIDSIFAKDREAYILLLTSASPQKIKERLKRHLGERPLERIIVNYGHRMSREEYGAIHLEAAEEIFIVGNRTLPAHDAINVECVDNICCYLNEIGARQKPRRITCVFEDLDTYAAFKTSEIFDEVKKLAIEFVPYNFYAGWANQVFVKQSHRNRLNADRVIAYPSVCGGGIKAEDDKRVHLVFVGTTNFAVAFAMEAAHVLHFPNFKRDNSLRTRITFIDRNADKERHLFITRNRHFFELQELIYRDLSDEATPASSAEHLIGIGKYPHRNFLDVEFEFIKGDVFSDRVRSELARWARDDRQYLSLFLAMTNQRDNFAVGMNMPDEVYDRQIPIFIRQDRSDNFVTNLREIDRAKKFAYHTVDPHTNELRTEQRHGRYANIYPFGMNDTGYRGDETVLLQAKLINYLYDTADYATNRFTDLLVLEAMPLQTLLAEADKAWRKRSVADKWSNLYAAYSISCKLASLRAMRGLDADDRSRDLQALTDDEIDTMAVVEHNRWNVEKLLMGFRRPYPEEDKYAHPASEKLLINNKKLFIHHDIRPYAELPEQTKQLDREFSKYIPWILRLSRNDDCA